MVCVAAFIILVLIGVAAALISIFNRDFGRKYLALLKKSFHCFGKRIRLQKCDTNFSEDVKTTLLKKVVIKKPKLVKPLSFVIEAFSAILIIVTIWSVAEAVKAGLALWVFGTCNVSQPSNCALGAESCSIDENNLNWFTEWGEIFANIPDRIRTWDASSYVNREDGLIPAFVVGRNDKTNNSDQSVQFANNRYTDPTINAIEIIDPGCSVCLQSYKNIINNKDFNEHHATAFVIYPVTNPSGELRFKNSDIITRYIYAANIQQQKAYNQFAGGSNGSPAEGSTDLSLDQQRDILYGYSEKIINRIFTEFNNDGIIYQTVFSEQLDGDQASTMLDDWLKEWGMTEEEVNQIRSELYSETMETILRQNSKLINDEIKPKGIPTMIYDGKKHLGLFK